MGCYINPPNETKEEFLQREGKKVELDYRWNDVPEGHLPVILVHNGSFTAAAVAYSEKEFKEFTKPSDDRPKKMFFVEIEKLFSVSNIQEYLERH